MSPIRVGLIGLSSVTTNVTASPGDGWAASAHLPYLLQSPRYEIVALLNSSVASAQAAIKRYNLPSSTKAYGSPSDLAGDPDVDLVVCCVRVDRHHQLTMPSIQAGKSIFVEWPLGSNYTQAEEMLVAARKSGSKTIVGLQGRASPVTQKVKELIESKVIGDLLSSELTLPAGFFGGSEPPGIDYTAKKEVGGNVFTILFGHTADAAIYALGGLHEFSSVLTTRWPDTKLLHKDGSFDRVIKREVPDHILLQGTLKNAEAPISIAVRAGKAFKDELPLQWHILGTTGQIRVTAPAPLSMGAGGSNIELFDHEKDTVESVEYQYADAVKDLPIFANNIGRCYELLADGAKVGDGLVDFEEAVKFHEILRKMENSWENKRFERI